MPDKHREFLIPFEQGKPDWSLIGLPAAANLPGVNGASASSVSLR